jgi:hypothetical protein
LQFTERNIGVFQGKQNRSAAKNLSEKKINFPPLITTSRINLKESQQYRNCSVMSKHKITTT